MVFKTLSEVADIVMGQSPDSESYNDKGDGVPFYQGKTDFGKRYPTVRMYCSAPKKIAEDGDILMSVRAPIGDVNIAVQKCCIGRGIAAIRPKADTDLLYLFFVLDYYKDKLAEQGTGTTFKAIGRDILKDFRIPMYSLAEQGEIVARLDGVEALLANRRAALAALDTLVKSRFQSQFGDLRTNSMHWPRKPFTECAIIESNMIHDFTNYADYPHIGIDSIEKNTGALKGYRTIGEDGVISGKYLFTDKHIIYSKIRPNLNKVALPDFEGLCSADAYAILPQEDICNRVYLCHVMRSPVFLNYILPFSSRTNMPKVNRKQVEGFTVPLPPIEEQNKFAAFVAAVERLRAQLTAAIESLTTLRAACMQHYFH